MVARTGYAINEATRPYWLNEKENPYVVDKDNPFMWITAAG